MLRYFLAIALAAAAVTDAQRASYALLTDVPGGGSSAIFRMADDARVLSTIGLLPQGYVPIDLKARVDGSGFVVNGLLRSTNANTVLEVDNSGVITTLGSAPVVFLMRGLDGDIRVLVSTPSGFAVAALQGLGFQMLGNLPPGLSSPATPHTHPGTGLMHIAAMLNGRRGNYGIDLATQTVTSLFSPVIASTTADRPFSSDAGGFLGGTKPAQSPAFLFATHYATGHTTLVGSVGAFTEYPIDVVPANGRDHPTRWRMVGFDQAQIQPVVIYDVDSAGGVVARRSLVGARGTPNTSLEPLGGPALAALRPGAPRDVYLRIRYPGEPGLPYAVGLSLTGIEPSLRLTDGRSLALVPDALTIASLTGGVPGIVSGTVGRLDANGRAFARLRGDRLGPAANGLTVFAVVVVLDPNASLGIPHISDPVRIEM